MGLAGKQVIDFDKQARGPSFHLPIQGRPDRRRRLAHAAGPGAGPGRESQGGQQALLIMCRPIGQAERGQVRDIQDGAQEGIMGRHLEEALGHLRVAAYDSGLFRDKTQQVRHDLVNGAGAREPRVVESGQARDRFGDGEHRGIGVIRRGRADGLAERRLSAIGFESCSPDVDDGILVGVRARGLDGDGDDGVHGLPASKCKDKSIAHG